MKCPKCGSENIFYNTSYDGKDYYICGNCKTHYSLPTVAVSKTEQTTAEMLLWLAENKSIDIRHTATDGIIYVWRNGNAVKFEGKTLTEAIIKAYEWARKEVTE